VRRLVFALLGLFAFGVAAVPPASATTPTMHKVTPSGSTCSEWTDSATGEESFICIAKDASTRTVQGLVIYNDPSGAQRTVTATLYVQQCQAVNNTPTNCSTIAANSKTASTVNDEYDVETSQKPAQFGWIYRTCASLSVNTTQFSYVNSCGPWVTGNFDQNTYQDLLLPQEPLIS
jgi:hypothetical protein